MSDKCAVCARCRTSPLMLRFVSLSLFAFLCGHSYAAVPVAAFLEQHCVECHDADVKKGGLDLTDLSFDKLDAASVKTWQHIFERVRDGEMPPKKKPQPEKTEKDLFLANLKQPLTSPRMVVCAVAGSRGSSMSTRCMICSASTSR